MTINNFIDKCFEPYQLHIKELEQSLENLTITYETLKLHDDEEISSLQAQIEKMKCCGNCKHQGVDCEWFINHKQPCTNLNKWQLRR